MNNYGHLDIVVNILKLNPEIQEITIKETSAFVLLNKDFWILNFIEINNTLKLSYHLSQIYRDIFIKLWGNWKITKFNLLKLCTFICHELT